MTIRATPRADVTAVLLSVGEPTVERALASLAAQTLPPAAIVRIDDVSPFHRALNAGIARVRTPFFVQVDADMRLDPTALADLRACIGPHVGAVIGGLRDPLRGSIVGVKLYRTAAAVDPVPDSITPAVDFLAAMRARGWASAHALAWRPGARALWHTFGEHQPDYTPAYTLAKFRLIGARYRHWRTGASLRRLFARLQASRHPVARLAQAGTALGLFWHATRDALQPRAPDAEATRLAALLLGPGGGPPARLRGDGRTLFLAHYRDACTAAQASDAAACRTRFDALAAAAARPAWVALVGFCRGLVARRWDPQAAAADFADLAAHFADEIPA